MRGSPQSHSNSREEGKTQKIKTHKASNFKKVWEEKTSQDSPHPPHFQVRCFSFKQKWHCWGYPIQLPREICRDLGICRQKPLTSPLCKVEGHPPKPSLAPGVSGLLGDGGTWVQVQRKQTPGRGGPQGLLGDAKILIKHSGGQA